jgi:hypothetical protein
MICVFFCSFFEPSVIKCKKYLLVEALQVQEAAGVLEWRAQANLDQR